MFLLTLALVLLVAVVPVMIGARLVGAKRRGFWVSLGALVVSYLIVGIAVRLLDGPGLLAIFAAPLGYMAILETTYLRGLAIAVIQYVLATVFVLVLMLVAFGSIVHGIDRLRHDTPFRVDMPAESV